MRTSIFQPFFSVVRLALFVLASVLAFGVGAAAQTLPYEADVAQDASVIRSGAGRGYYVVAEIAKGQRVTVVDERFLWYAIQCPESVTCFIEQKNVDAKGDGKRGVVNTDDTNVYFSHMTKGPSESYRPGGKLHAGDVVEIIEAVDNAYRVVAPKNIYVYMRPNSLTATLADAANDAAAEVPAPAVAEPAAETVATAEPQVVIDVEPIVLNPPVIVAPADAQPLAEAPQTTNAQPAEVPAVEISFDDIPAPATDAKADLLNDPTAEVPLPDVAVTTQAENEMLRAVEVAILPYFTLPVDQQPIAKMVRGYANATQVQDLSDRDMAIISARLTELERNRELAQAIKQVEVANNEINDTDAPAEPAPAPTETAATEAQPAEPSTEPVAVAVAESTPPQPAEPSTPAVTSGYDAVGILTASSVHTGGNQPKLFRLLDPTGRRTVAYIEPHNVDAVQMIGQLVGVIGTKTYDPTTKLNLIVPTRIDVLGAR